MSGESKKYIAEGVEAVKGVNGVEGVEAVEGPHGARRCPIQAFRWLEWGLPNSGLFRIPDKSRVAPISPAGKVPVVIAQAAKKK